MTEAAFTILVAEDEPAAARYFRSAVGLKCPGFSVTAVSENGLECLEAVRKENPDLVVTDVRMPVMDGIELIAKLKAEFPRLPVVIVSGYEEFEYARKALNTGVTDYLLKPLNPEKLRGTLESLVPVLLKNRETRLADELRGILAGRPAESFSTAVRGVKFRAAVLRRGGLPSRFLPWGDGADDRTGAPAADAVIRLEGRDARETVFLAPSTSVAADDFLRIVSGEARAGGLRYTVVSAPGDPDAAALPDCVREMYRSVDNASIPGESQLRTAPVAAPGFPDTDPVFTGHLGYILDCGRFDLLEAPVRDLATRWKKERRPFISIEAALRKILYLVRDKSAPAHGGSTVNIEYLLDERLGSVVGFDDLPDAVLSLIGTAAGIGGGEDGRRDVPGFFDSILRYVGNTCRQPLTLGSLCARFRISRSYMSRLFRKYENRTFVEYLTDLRMDAAKRLIIDNPSMPLKDVASFVGFQDQFYFSRVFKAKAGIPPSEFQNLHPGSPAE